MGDRKLKFHTRARFVPKGGVQSVELLEASQEFGGEKSEFRVTLSRDTGETLSGFGLASCGVRVN